MLALAFLQSHELRLQVVDARVAADLAVVHVAERAGHLRGRERRVLELRAVLLELELDLLDRLVREQNLRDLVRVLELLPFLVEIGEQPVELLLVVAQLRGEIGDRLAHEQPMVDPRHGAFERERDQHAGRDDREMPERLLPIGNRMIRHVDFHRGIVLRGECSRQRGYRGRTHSRSNGLILAPAAGVAQSR